MTRTFSLTSDGLSTYIGYALYSNDEVALVSPWISDITVKIPVNNEFDDRRMLLSEAVRQLEGETRVNVLIRSGEEHNNYIRGELAETVQVHSIRAHTSVPMSEENPSPFPIAASSKRYYCQ